MFGRSEKTEEQYKKDVIETAKRLSSYGLDMDIEKLVPYALAKDSHRGTSMMNEIRGYNEQEWFMGTIEYLYEKFIDKCHTEEQKNGFLSSLNYWIPVLANAKREYLHSHSKVISVMVTGGGNFPTARNEKNNRYTDNKRATYSELINKAEKSLEKTVYKLSPRGKMSDLERAEYDLEKLRGHQNLFKEVNKVARNKDLTPEEKIDIMNSFPDFHSWWSAVGDKKAITTLNKGLFPSYVLTNNNANIKRLEKRVTELKTKELRESQEIEVLFQNEDGEEIRLFEESERWRVEFPFKPEADVRADLKSAGLHWSKYYGVWMRKNTVQAFLPIVNALEKHYKRVSDLPDLQAGIKTTKVQFSKMNKSGYIKMTITKSDGSTSGKMLHGSIDSMLKIKISPEVEIVFDDPEMGKLYRGEITENEYYIGLVKEDQKLITLTKEEAEEKVKELYKYLQKYHGWGEISENSYSWDISNDKEKREYESISWYYYKGWAKKASDGGYNYVGYRHGSGYMGKTKDFNLKLKLETLIKNVTGDDPKDIKARVSSTSKSLKDIYDKEGIDPAKSNKKNKLDKLKEKRTNIIEKGRSGNGGSAGAFNKRVDDINHDIREEISMMSDRKSNEYTLTGVLDVVGTIKNPHGYRLILDNKWLTVPKISPDKIDFSEWVGTKVDLVYFFGGFFHDTLLPYDPKSKEREQKSEDNQTPKKKAPANKKDSASKSNIVKFEVGSIYTHGFITNSESVAYYRVVKRTEKTITIQPLYSDMTKNGEPKNKRVKVYSGSEVVEPLGSYSMSPTLDAKDRYVPVDKRPEESQRFTLRYKIGLFAGNIRMYVLLSSYDMKLHDRETMKDWLGAIGFFSLFDNYISDMHDNEKYYNGYGFNFSLSLKDMEDYYKFRKCFVALENNMIDGDTIHIKDESGRDFLGDLNKHFKELEKGSGEDLKEKYDDILNLLYFSTKGKTFYDQWKVAPVGYGGSKVAVKGVFPNNFTLSKSGGKVRLDKHGIKIGERSLNKSKDSIIEWVNTVIAEQLSIFDISEKKTPEKKTPEKKTPEKKTPEEKVIHFTDRKGATMKAYDITTKSLNEIIKLAGDNPIQFRKINNDVTRVLSNSEAGIFTMLVSYDSLKECLQKRVGKAGYFDDKTGVFVAKAKSITDVKEYSKGTGAKSYKSNFDEINKIVASIVRLPKEYSLSISPEVALSCEKITDDIFSETMTVRYESKKVAGKGVWFPIDGDGNTLFIFNERKPTNYKSEGKELVIKMESQGSVSAVTLSGLKKACHSKRGR